MCTEYLTSTLDEGDWSNSGSDHFIPEEKENRCPLGRTMAEWKRKQFLTPARNRILYPSVVEPVSNLHTD
jgi:hypothetical protein